MCNEMSQITYQVATVFFRFFFRSCELEYYGFAEGVQGEEHGQVVATGEHADCGAV